MFWFCLLHVLGERKKSNSYFFVVVVSINAFHVTQYVSYAIFSSKFVCKTYFMRLFLLCFYFWLLIHIFGCCCLLHSDYKQLSLESGHRTNYNKFIAVILVVKAKLNLDYRIVVNANAIKVLVMVVKVGNGIAKGVFIV